MALWRFLGDLFHVHDSAPTPAEIAQKRRPVKAKATVAHRRPLQTQSSSSLGYNDFLNAIVDTDDIKASHVGSSSVTSRPSSDLDDDPFTPRNHSTRHTRDPPVQVASMSYAGPQRPKRGFDTRLKAPPPPPSSSRLPRLRERSMQVPPLSSSTKAPSSFAKAPSSFAKATSSFTKAPSSFTKAPSSFTKAPSSFTKAPSSLNPAIQKLPPLSTHRRGSKWLFDYQDNQPSANVDSFVTPAVEKTRSNRVQAAKGVSSASTARAPRTPIDLTHFELQLLPQQRRRSPYHTRNHAFNIASELSGRNSDEDGRSSTSSLRSPPVSTCDSMASYDTTTPRRPVAGRLTSSEYLARHASNDYLTVHPPEGGMCASKLPPPPTSSNTILSQFQAIRSRSDSTLVGLMRRPSMDFSTRLSEAAQRIPGDTLLPTCRRLARTSTPKTTKRVRFTD
ncbi:hypothetical protein H257_00493 [Aphanomyces astaci]|uniref:Uncharacterized protein n=1 Tax=Aphanomyces astaci TaxID=112090 RepID=W4HB17_APHAT|nr:hypothetical protein H257_00493 [Aphanomyces astaci]ETV89117.1 hypothetical protein H257_00493 [Aphanomyces astaci]|eukprot:XP_009821517.1 hypothetical protein H257_00493 [Aphanomyces astaci]